MVLDFVSVVPTLPSKIEYVMLESFTCSAIIRYDDKLSTIRPQIWTNAINKKNPSGKWHSLSKFLLYLLLLSKIEYNSTVQKKRNFRAKTL